MGRQSIMEDFATVRSALEDAVKHLMMNGYDMRLHENFGDALYSLTRIEKAYSEKRIEDVIVNDPNIQDHIK